MKTLYQIVGLPTGNLDMLTFDELAALYPGIEKTFNGSHLRPELQDQPRLPDMAGPSWGGWRDESGQSVFLENDRDPNSPPKSYSRHKGPIFAYVVRYDTWESADFLSR